MQDNRFKITLHTSQGQFEELIAGESIELGRNISADLPVMASGVSRSHLQLYLKHGAIRLKDLGSTNGTYIKGVRVEAHKEIEYTAGTRISLGQAGCFIRVELAPVGVKIESSPLKEGESSYTQTNVPVGTKSNSSEDSNIIESFFGKSKVSSDAQDRKLQKRFQAQTEQAEKLIKQRISEAEASIRRGIQKARIQAKDITNEARKEAETLKIKAQVEKNKMLSEVEEEISNLKSKILKEANDHKIEVEKKIAEKTSNIESEISLAQGQIKKDVREAEALVNGAKVEVENLKDKHKKLNLEIKELLEKKNQARQECKEVEVKLATIDEAHEVKSSSLQSELIFINKEIEKSKSSLETLLKKNEDTTLEHSEKMSKIISETKELSKAFDHLTDTNHKLISENESLEKQIEELDIQLKYKKNNVEEARDQVELLLHQRDELEDYIVQTRDEEELRLHEFKKQIDLDADKVRTQARREADLLVSEAENQKKDFLESINQSQIDHDLKLKEEREQAILEVKELRLDAQRRADLLISKARVEREALLKKTEERLAEQEERQREAIEQSNLESRQRTKEAQRRADQLIAVASDEEKAILDAAHKRLKEAQTKADSITTKAIAQEKNLIESAEALHREASEIQKGAVKAFEREKKKIIDQAMLEKKKILDEVLKLKNGAVSEKDEILKAAHIEKESLLKETKAKFEKVDTDYRAKMAEFEEYKKTEEKKLDEELEKQAYISKNNLERELAEIQFTRTKEIEEQIRILQTYRADYAESWSTAIVFKAQESFDTNLSEEESAKARDDLKEFAKAVINEENPNEQSEIQNLMKFDPVHREKKKKLFKQQMIFAGLAVFALILSPYIMKSVKHQAQLVADNSVKASEERVAKFEEEREKLTTYVAEPRFEYLESYTDRIIYTPNYVKNELSKEYREEWFLNLDTFFVEELILSDEAIVTFISKETNLIKDLQELREGINAQFLEKGVERMRNVESKFIADVRALLKTDEKFARFENFKKDYYLASFPIDVARSLATEKNEDVE